MIPLSLFKDSIFSFGSLAMMIMSFGLFGVIAFLPMFLQAVVGISATYSGEVLIPLMLTSMVGSIVSGVLLKRTGYKIWLLAGPLIAAAGLWMLASLNSDSSALDAVVFLLIAGLGLGFTMANYIVAAQNVCDKKLMGTMTSSMSLFRSIGGTIGITVLGALVNRRMVSELAANLPPDAGSYLPTTDINSLGGILLTPNAGLPEPIVEGIRLSLSNSITSVFMISAFILLAAWVVTLFIKSVPMKSKEDYMNGKSASSGDRTSTSK
jgi:fucose permease